MKTVVTRRHVGGPLHNQAFANRFLACKAMDVITRAMSSPTMSQLRIVAVRAAIPVVGFGSRRVQNKKTFRESPVEMAR